MSEEYHDDYEDDDERALDEHETALVRQDLFDLERFEATFRAEGYRGVAIYCHDCGEEHYYPWDMLRENLHILLETGETPVHEPAFEPEPEDYVHWEYAQGYVDALNDVGVQDRRDLSACTRCGFRLEGELTQSNFCPRCGMPLLAARLSEVLAERGASEEEITAILRAGGLPT